MKGATELHRTDRLLNEDNYLWWYDEAAPWSRSNYLMWIQLLPSSDDSDSNFSGTSCRTRTETMIKEDTLCPGLFNWAYL
jgi:hypothetical protein